MSPEAFIAVKKNRTKTYSGQVYLKNGTEYQIELFNPLTLDVLAEITIDGKPIGNAGVVLRPGERVFLERYLDSPQKFKFSTYEVNTKNDAVRRAIEQNGKVEIKFFKESLFHTTPSINYNPTITWNYPTFSYTSTSTFARAFGTCLYSNSDVKLTSNKVESNITGKTERGSYSSQQFTSVSKSWESFPIKVVNYKILPIEMKPATSREIRTFYCTECGRKTKRGWKYCAGCGTLL